MIIIFDFFSILVFSYFELYRLRRRLSPQTKPAIIQLKCAIPLDEGKERSQEFPQHLLWTANKRNTQRWDTAESPGPAPFPAGIPFALELDMISPHLISHLEFVYRHR